MDMNNQMIANNLRLYVNDNISYENPALCHSVLSTAPYSYTYEDTPACNYT